MLGRVWVMEEIKTPIQMDLSAQSPLWDYYGTVAQQYLDRPEFKGIKLKGADLKRAAMEVYNNTGKYIPVDFALAQGQAEDLYGRESKWKSPKYDSLSNPFNIGVYDKIGPTRFYKTPYQGALAYYGTLANQYLVNGKTHEDLLKPGNYTNSAKDRYASRPDYEQYVSGIRDGVRNYIRTGNEKGKSAQTQSRIKAVKKKSDFDIAFDKARKAGLKTFIHKGKPYTTQMK